MSPVPAVLLTKKAIDPMGPWLKHVPKTQATMGKVLQVVESKRGFAHSKFIQDTLTNWVPKMLVARSLAEMNEGTFLEFVESMLGYYSISAIGQKILQPLYHSLSPKSLGQKRFAQNLIYKSVNDLVAKHPKALPYVLPVKAAIILASMGTIIIGGHYSLNFVKNLMTYKVFDKSQFSEVVNLSNKQARREENQHVIQKAYTRILQCLGISAGLIVAGGLLAKFGPRAKGLHPLLKKFVSIFDFSYDFSCRKVKFGLTKPLMRMWFGIGYLGYIDAARDKLERVETATRVGTVLFFLDSGNELIQKGLLKVFGKSCPEILQGNTIISLNDVVNKALQLAKQNPTLARQQFAKMLWYKNAFFFIPMAIAILVPGIGLGILSRFWTAYRFNKSQLQEKAMAADSLSLSGQKTVYGARRGMYAQQTSKPNPFSTQRSVALPQKSRPVIYPARQSVYPFLQPMSLVGYPMPYLSADTRNFPHPGFGNRQ